MPLVSREVSQPPLTSLRAAQKKLSLSSRRYLGNKSRLASFIRETVLRECGEPASFADLFAGTGAVAGGFADSVLLCNDLLYCNYLCNYAWFGSERHDPALVMDLLSHYNRCSCRHENYMTENFTDTYFNYENCSKIGFIREDIANRYKKGEINFREMAILVASLLYALDKIANTCGHYDAWRKNGEKEKKLELLAPFVSNENSPENRCFNEDANQLAQRIGADVVYLDPPYNSRQYCDAYHLLENVARWQKPEVFGVAGKMDRSFLKSRYCTVEAGEALEDLVKKIRAQYIALSYNNMGEKGNPRSNARISDGNIFDILSQKGRVKVFSCGHRPFTAGKSNIVRNVERLFICAC